MSLQSLERFTDDLKSAALRAEAGTRQADKSHAVPLTYQLDREVRLWPFASVCGHARLVSY
jgi:hypothetical protein